MMADSSRLFKSAIKYFHASYQAHVIQKQIVDTEEIRSNYQLP